MKKGKASKWRRRNNNRRSIATGAKSKQRRKDYLHWRNVRELDKNQEERRALRRRPQKRLTLSRNVAKIFVPENFSLINHPEEALAFIAELKRLSRGGKNVFISMEDVKYISHDAIATLLSVISKFRNRYIRVYGDKPKDGKCNNILERSGFFNYVKGVVSEENKATKNQIITRLEKDVKPEKTAPLVRECMRTVGGRAERNQAIQGMLIELMANTHNHASKGNKKLNWWLSIDHDKENNKVSFVFLDNGLGILETINLKIFKKLGQFFSGNRVSLLQECFSGDIGSRTQYTNRGRGLPKIQNRFDDKFVSNLIVITNNVILRFENKTGTELKNDFEGTLYSWELDLNCRPWTSK